MTRRVHEAVASPLPSSSGRMSRPCMAISSTLTFLLGRFLSLRFLQHSQKLFLFPVQSLY